MHRFLVYVTVVAGCGSGGRKADPDASPDALDSVSGVIGVAGGTLAMPNGPTLVFPRGAVDHDTTITIVRTAEVQPDGITPVFALEPDGLVFAQPITATIPGAGAGTSIYWSKHNGGSGYARIGGSVSGSDVSAEQVHFSGLYAGPTSGNRTVSGSQVLTYLRPAGITNHPIDLSTFQPKILVPDGAGGYTTLTGSGLADGSFAIDNVPDGPYVLATGTKLFVTSAEAFDAGQMAIGRPDATVATTGGTLNLNITGMDPYKTGDMIEAYSAEVDMWWFELADQLTPAVDDTTLAGPVTTAMGLTSNLYYGEVGQPRYLIDGAAGDRLNIAQLHTLTNTDGVDYLALTKTFSPAAFTQTDGGTTDITGAFTDVAATNTVSIDFRVSQFKTATGFDGTNCNALNPGSTPLVISAGIVAEPVSKDYGPFGANADLVFVRKTFADGDVVANNLGYGLPSQGTWAPMAIAGALCVAHTKLGSNTEAFSLVQVGYNDDVANLGNPITPRIGPVGAPKVAGLDAFAPQTGVGTTPRVSWTAPSIGTPTHYRVTFWHLTVAGSDTKRQNVLEINTADTKVDVPPGYLLASEPYVIQIEADEAPDVAAPNRTRLTGGYSRILSDIITL